MANENWFFQMPQGEITILDVLFGIPNQWTDGMYINMLITGFYGTFFIASMQMQERPDLKEASIYAGVGTFMVTLSFVLLSTYTNTTVAGQNQLIPAALVMLASIIWKYVSTGDTTL